MLYKIKNLIKRYDGRIILDLPNASFEKGKVIGLLGPNGAGKTTLLEILAFLLTPTSGKVLFENKEVDYSHFNMVDIRQKVVLVQQKPILFSTSVSKNVEFPLKIRQKAKSERRKIVKELLGVVGMEEFKDAKAHHLSGGETQRVAIAQALACGPNAILMDEPTASVDVENQIIIERIIQEINQDKGISVIFTTHDMIQARRVADETVFLFEGRLAESIYENIFSGHIQSDSNGRKYCVLQNNLRLPIQTDRSGPVRIFIKPDLITIRPSPLNLPEPNIHKGKLLQLTHEQNRIRALVDVGIPLSILIPDEVFANMPMELGKDVWLTCPPESIGFF